MVFFRQRVEEIVFWTMGGLSRASWKAVASAVPYAIAGVGVLWFQSRALNAFSFGEEEMCIRDSNYSRETVVLHAG